MGTDGKELADAFRGALLGTFCGDALGAHVEGWRHEDIETAYGTLDTMLDGQRGLGRYTDDTEMMVALAESLVERGRVDGEHLAGRFVEVYDASRGYGRGTVTVLGAIARGVPWDEAATQVFGGGSYGNGSAMRVAPVGVLYHDDLEALREAAEGQARVSHAHPLGCAGAALQAAAVALAVRAGGPDAFEPHRVLADLRGFVEGGTDAGAVRVLLERLEAVEVMLSEAGDPGAVARALGNDSTCPRSVPAAIYSALVRGASPRDAIVYAVSLGGDTDTIGAMAGAVSGALHGASALPEEWLDVLEDGGRGKGHVLRLADELLELWSKGR